MLINKLYPYQMKLLKLILSNPSRKLNFHISRNRGRVQFFKELQALKNNLKK